MISSGIVPGFSSLCCDAEGDISRLILRQQEFLLPARHARRAFDDDPVLRAVMVHLQRQLRRTAR